MKKKNRIPPSESQEGGARSFLPFDVFLQFDVRLNVVAHLETLLKGLHLLLFHASHVDEIGILDESWILSSIAATRARGIGQPAFVPRMVDNGLPQGSSKHFERTRSLEISFSNHSIYFLLLLLLLFNRCRYNISLTGGSFKVCQK